MQAADLYVTNKAEENATQKPATAEAADARVQNFLKGLATAYASGLVSREGVDAAGDAEVEDPETSTSRRETRALIDRALTDIGDPEGTILRRHYFLDEDLQDAAAHMGLSKSWGSRLHARGIEKLAARLSELRGQL